MAEQENGRRYLEVTKCGVDFFKEHKDMFLYGRLAEIPDYRCKSLTMDWEARAEQKNTFTYTKTFPAICACVWESSVGERKMFAYNYSDGAKTMEFDGKVYEVAPKSFSCFDIAVQIQSNAIV